MTKTLGFFKAYGAFWRHYANFEKRTTKEAFWKAWVIHSVVLLALAVPIFPWLINIIEEGDLFGWFWLIPICVYPIATIVPTIALIIRRLHDIDRHGCWILLFILVPIAGQITFYIMLSRSAAPYDVFSGRTGAGPYGKSEGLKGSMSSPYGQSHMYTHPLPSPRGYAPSAGGNKAAVAIVLSIILLFANIAYSSFTASYVYKNFDDYYESLLGEWLYGFGLGDYWDDWYDDWDDWDDDWDDWDDDWDDWDDWDEDWDDWDDDWDDWDDEWDDWDSDMSADEQAAVDYVREGTLAGYSEFTIEEVLLSYVDRNGLYWECYEDYDGESPEYYVIASGVADGTFYSIYAEFIVYSDGIITLYNLYDGDERDEFDEDAIELYGEWYKKMLSGERSASAA